MLTRLDAYAVGVAAWRLGAGRARKEDPVLGRRRRGDARQAGRHRDAPASPCWSCTPTTPERFERALDALDGAFEIGASYEPTPLVIERVSA